MAMDDRRRVQEQFMSGNAEIVVATNAFGMGIDKADVRYVVHYNMPGTLEAYYQEAGRAGRDGDPSNCLMLYVPSDRYLQEFFIDSAHPPPETIHAIYDFLRSHKSDPIELTQDELKEELGLSIGTDRVGTCERILEKAGVLERLEPHRNMAAVRVESDSASLPDLLPKQARKQRKLAKGIEELVGSRRFDFVYFRPNELADSLGMDIVSLNRGLRELNKAQTFAYVPPFRGRAVRMIRRDVEFSELNIDLTELKARRKANFEKLDRVVQFATTPRCRQQEILLYFGDESTKTCGNCDNCNAGRSQVSSAAWIHKAVLIALSGVARSRGRFGKSLVSQMLCGSNSAKIRKWNLDELSTFGLLSHLSQSDVSQLLESLASVGLLLQSEKNRFRPTLSISDEGNDVMRGKRLVPPVPIPKSI